MAEPLLPVGIESIKYKPVTVKHYQPKGEVRIVHGEEAKQVIEKTLPKLFSSPLMSDAVGTPRNVYYRVYKSDEGYGVFYLFEWDEQVFPPHKYDYEPVIVLTDKYGNPREVYVDGYHYFIKKYKLPRGATDYHLYSDTPWRGMKVRWTTPDKDEVELYPINEKTGQIGPTPKYLSDKTIARLRHRRENPLKINERLIRDPWSVRQAEHWMTYRAPTPEEFMYDIAENYGLAKYIKGPLSLNIVLALMKAKMTIENLISKVATALSSLIRRREPAKEVYKHYSEKTTIKQ